MRRTAVALVAVVGVVVVALAGWSMANTRPARSGSQSLISSGSDGRSVVDGLHLASYKQMAQVPLPGDCRPVAAKQFGFESRITNGTLHAGPVDVRGISASLCGTASIVDAPPGSGCRTEVRVTVPPDGQFYSKLRASLSVIPGITPTLPFRIHPGPLTSGLGCGSSSGGLRVPVTGTLVGSAGLFGLSCGVPVTVTVRGTFTGDPRTGMTAVLSARNFALRYVNPSSTYCPGTLPAQMAEILHFPITHGDYVTLPAKAEIYTAP